MNLARRTAGYTRLLLIALVAGMSTVDLARAQGLYRLTIAGGDDQSGFANRPLSKLLRARIAVGDSVGCEKLSVKFTPYGSGSAGASPARAVWRDGRCTAEAAWKLPGESGTQYLEAIVIGGSGENVLSNPVRYEATARAYPRVIFGLAFVVDELELDSLEVTRPRLTAAETRYRVQPVIGADFPLWVNPRVRVLEHLRPFVGVSFAEPERELLVGLSILPLISGPRLEDLPIQIVTGARFQRVSVTDANETDWNARWFFGGTTNGGSLLGALISRF